MSQADVIAAFGKVSKAMAAASPMKGVFFPSPGKHVCILEDITFDGNSSTKIDGKDAPAMAIGFRYRLVEDPESPTNPRAFNGKMFYLPLDDSAYDAKPGKKGSKFGMDRDRFMGHLTTILGRDISDPSNMGSEFALVLQKLQEAKTSGAAITLEVETVTREYSYKDKDTGKDKEGVDRYELLTAKLSS